MTVSDSNIGYATISILPNALGFGAALSKGIAPQMAAAGAAGGAGLLGAIKKALPVAAVVAAVGTLYKIGSTFDDMGDTIRAGTGKTGAALADLVTSGKNIGKEIPASFADIGTTITGLNQRLGLTGPTLELLSKQFLEAGRVTKESLDMGTITASLSIFNITGAATTTAMDTLFRASQATGVSMNNLASAVQKGAPVLRQFGFSFGDSAALMGILDKAGLATQTTLMALKIGLVNFAKAGKDPQVALKGTITEIQNFTKAGNDPAALALSAKIFGTRGAPQFLAAIKSGKLSLDDLFKAAGMGTDTILGAADATTDFAERWRTFMNIVLEVVEPISTRVFNAFGDGMKFLNTGISGLVATFQGGGFSALGDKIGASISAAWPGIQAQLAKWGTAFWAWIQPQIVPMIEKLGELLGALGTWLLDTGLPWLGEHLKTWGIAFWAWIQPMIGPFLAELGKLLLKFWIWSETVAFPAIEKKLAEWALAFIKWVPGASWSMMNEMGKLMARLVLWMVTVAAPAMIVQLAKWALAFIKWIPGAALSLIVEMNKLTARLDIWMVTVALPWIVRKLAGWALAFARWVPGAAVSMLVEFGKLLGRLGVWWVTTAIPAIVGWVAGMPKRIASAASGMWDGLTSSFRSAMNWIIRKWNDLSFTIGGGNIMGVTLPSTTLNTPNVPLLAQGGIVPATPGGRLVRVAEAGYAEAVVPLNGRQSLGNSLGTFDYDRLAAATAAAVADAISRVNVQSYLDGKNVTASVDQRIGRLLR